MKVAILSFETENLVTLKYKNVKEGVIQFDKDREIEIDHAKPLLYQKWTMQGKKYFPFYMVKWNSATPFNINASIQNPDKKLSFYTPKVYKQIVKNTTLSTLLTLKGKSSKEMFIWLLLGIALGFFAGYFVISIGGIIPQMTG